MIAGFEPDVEFGSRGVSRQASADPGSIMWPESMMAHKNQQSTAGATLLLPQASHSTSRSLSPDLLSQSVRRLRVLVLLYAFTFFMAGFVPNLVSAADRAMFFSHPEHWAPGVLSIAVALVMWALTYSKRLPLPLLMTLGLCFEVASSYGIALAEYLEPTRLNMNGWIGLSWVGVWTPALGRWRQTRSSGSSSRSRSPAAP